MVYPNSRIFVTHSKKEGEEELEEHVNYFSALIRKNKGARKSRKLHQSKERKRLSTKLGKRLVREAATKCLRKQFLQQRKVD